MSYLKSLRSLCAGSAMIPAAFLSVIASGCADKQAVAPELSLSARTPRVAQDVNLQFDDFFVAWSASHSSGPIQTQNFALDTRQNRQYGGWWPDEALLNFARANRGQLYINGDEPDQYCINPLEYAEMYNHFVEVVLTADPTARFSPAGFAEPNERCCPPGDEACMARQHSLGYANQFYDAYVQRYGEAPRVDEWRFHDFALTVPVGDVAGWWSRVNAYATWSAAHGAKLVLGGWGFHRWKDEPVTLYQEHLKQAMGRLMADSRINETVYWSYEQWAGEANYLANPDGSLTPQGQTFANPLTDVPTQPTAIAASNGRAKLVWNNPTNAWGAEVEYWVRPPGSSTFVVQNTERVATAGATESPTGVFHIGDVVKARVRYYNRFGQAAWSDYSNSVAMVLGEPGTNKGPGSRKGPRFCVLPTGVQSQRCD